MAYSKHTWVNNELPAINETNLNNMENGIEEAHNNFVNYKLKEDFAIITGSFTFTDGQSDFMINYPEGFNYNNCVVISVMTNKEQGYTEGYFPTSVGYVIGALGKAIQLKSDKIRMIFCNPMEGSHSSGTQSYDYKLVLLKISEVVNNE